MVAISLWTVVPVVDRHKKVRYVTALRSSADNKLLAIATTVKNIGMTTPVPSED